MKQTRKQINRKSKLKSQLCCSLRNKFFTCTIEIHWNFFQEVPLYLFLFFLQCFVCFLSWRPRKMLNMFPEKIWIKCEWILTLFYNTAFSFPQQLPTEKVTSFPPKKCIFFSQRKIRAVAVVFKLKSLFLVQVSEIFQSLKKEFFLHKIYRRFGEKIIII